MLARPFERNRCGESSPARDGVIEVVWQSYGGTDETPLPPREAAGSEPKA